MDISRLFLCVAMAAVSAAALAASPGDTFVYATPEGHQFLFSVNADGSTVTLEQGLSAGNVVELTIPGVVDGLDSRFSVTDIAPFAMGTSAKNGKSYNDFGGALPLEGVRRLILSEGIERTGQNCFELAADLEEVSLPASLRNMSYSMLADSPKLRIVSLPSNSALEEIASYALMNCGSLREFRIPASVKKVEKAPWRNCRDLRALSIADGNYDFKVIDGVLYSGDRRRLLQYPSGREAADYSVHYGTRVIENAAFEGNDHLRTVFMPASLDSISHGAFKGCLNLENVQFADKIDFVGNMAFQDCPMLQNVKLYGNPKYTDSGIDSYYSFAPHTKVDIKGEAPAPELAHVPGFLFEKVWSTVAALPDFQTMEIKDNQEYGFPKYMGKGKAAVYGNADPKADVLRILDVMSPTLIAWQNTDEKGRVTRYYIDRASGQVLYFFGGIGGNDLVVALFIGGDRKKIDGMLKKLGK